MESTPNVPQRCGNLLTESKVLADITMAFDPSDISTVLPETEHTTCTLTVHGELSYDISSQFPQPVPLTIADVAQNCSTIPGNYYLKDHPFNMIMIAPGDGIED